MSGFNELVILVAIKIIPDPDVLDGYRLCGAYTSPKAMDHVACKEFNKLRSIGTPKKNLFHELANFSGVLQCKGQLEVMKLDRAYFKGWTPYPVSLLAVIVDGEFDQARHQIVTSPLETCAGCTIGGWFPGDPVLLLSPEDVAQSLEPLRDFTIVPYDGEAVELAPYLSKLCEVASYVANR